VVPSSSVTLKNIETGAIAATTTNLKGIYTFPLLQPGNYQVSVTARGFNMVTKTVLSTLGSSVTANLTLMVQSVQQTVEVTSEVTGVQTEDANLETNFNAKQISVLPNPGNDLSAVALTSPGVVMNTTGGSTFWRR
jgi:hypothetical protein